MSQKSPKARIQARAYSTRDSDRVRVENWPSVKRAILVNRTLVDFYGSVDTLDEGVGGPKADGARKKPERHYDDGGIPERGTLPGRSLSARGIRISLQRSEIARASSQNKSQKRHLSGICSRDLNGGAWLKYGVPSYYRGSNGIQRRSFFFFFRQAAGRK